MAYKVIILYRLYMPSYVLGTFTEYPYERNIKIKNESIEGKAKKNRTINRLPILPFSDKLLCNIYLKILSFIYFDIMHFLKNIISVQC